MTQSTDFDNTYYNIAQWGDGYFTVNAQGNIETALQAGEPGVEIKAVVNAASRAGLKLPLLIRFTDILHDRVKKINEAFNDAIEAIDYRGQYTLVYPIKVNQEHCVVKALLQAPSHRIGLEAGSKPELMAVMGLLGQNPSTIVCNGYKDACYIRMALIAQQMGHRVYIVIEKRSELDMILKQSHALGIRPRIGVRIRLITKGAGKWENTGGAKSKFGLNAEQVLELVHRLKDAGFLDCLELMHCHLGSQIANILDIRQCMQEVARYYVELRKLNAPIATVDVGGGLGVDYEGTHSSTDCSVNYGLNEYATNILLALRHVCEDNSLPEPHIISESGRALTAHHALIVTNITDAEIVKPSRELPIPEADDSHVIGDICDTYRSMSASSTTEIFNYAFHSLEEAHALFKHGVISLKEKAKVEQFFTAICFEIHSRLDETNPSDSELLALINERLAAKIFCNISFFQSMPDAWAIGQIFPVAPITHLHLKPSMHSILQDLTCDSDGTLKQYASQSVLSSTLMLPAYDAANPYHMAFFLVGAYQEILGNLHNLFGDINSLDVKLLRNGEFEMNDLVSGDTVTNVLNLAHFDIKRLLQSYEKQLLNTDLPEDTIELYLNELRSVFSQFTYLDSHKMKGVS